MMDKLKAELDKRILQIEGTEDFNGALDSLISVYPFNKYEYIISSLLGRGLMTIDEYKALRDEYLARNEYLHLFEISAPRDFGEKWAQDHLKTLIPELATPTRSRDPKYSGEYDLLLDDKIRIEVKASRVVDASEKGSLVERALSIDSNKNFLMNFQQIKPECCDVFVWIAVWREEIRYWVLSSEQVKQLYSDKQHRGNKGEGQFHMTHTNIRTLDAYYEPAGNLLNSIRNAWARSQG